MHHRPVRLSWARLLKRVFDLDQEHCPNCGGELKIIAAILEQPVIEKILTHLGLQGSLVSDSQDSRVWAPLSALCRSQPASKTASSRVRCRAEAVMSKEEERSNFLSSDRQLTIIDGVLRG